MSLRHLALTLCCLVLPATALAKSPALERTPAPAPAQHLLQEIDTGAPLLTEDPMETWLYIDLDSRALSVFRGREVVWTIDHVAIGKNGARRIRFQGSRMTPTGTFRVDRINPGSRFRRFFEINYPSPATARDALRQGLISAKEARRIRRHYAQHRVALPSTSLGGYIGIHGLGGRSAYLNRQMDWTDGCLAVTDAEIDRLARWVTVGTQVLITGGQQPGRRLREAPAPRIADRSTQSEPDWRESATGGHSTPAVRSAPTS